MNTLFLKAAGGVASIALVACNLIGTPTANPELVTITEASNGTYSYAAATDAGPPETPEHGDLGAASGLTVTGVSPNGIDFFGCPGSSAPDTETIIVSGSLVDATGSPQPFCLQINGVIDAATAQIGAGSVACFENLLACSPLSGTITTTTFATVCNQEEDCSLSITGTLKATTTWPGGSFDVDLTLDHRDTYE